MANLFQISDEFLTLIYKAEENEGEISEELAEQIQLSEENLIEKACNYIGVIKMKEGEVETAKKEIERLQKFINREERTVDWLKNNLKFAVKEFDLKEVGNNKLTTRKSSSVSVEDVEAIPTEYVKETTKTTKSADKKAIKEAIQAGKEIEGCSIVTKETLKIS